MLTTNLSNADTPDYVPNDIAKPGFAKLIERANRQAMPVDLQRTNGQHFEGLAMRRVQVGQRETDSFEVAPAGNAVIIEEQAQKLQETRLQYEMSTGIYTKIKGLMQTALGNSGA